jgi:hypothetical protein
MSARIFRIIRISGISEWELGECGNEGAERSLFHCGWTYRLQMSLIEMKRRASKPNYAAAPNHKSLNRFQA